MGQSCSDIRQKYCLFCKKNNNAVGSCKPCEQQAGTTCQKPPAPPPPEHDNKTDDNKPQNP